MTHPHKQTTHQLMAELFAIHVDVQRHVQHQGERITPLERQIMMDSVASLQTVLIAWQAERGKGAMERGRKKTRQR